VRSFYLKASPVDVVGAGLAGSEAAWQLARRGIPVRLFEMRPARMTPAHQTAFFAELVCSNSLRSASLETAVGLLKEEMRRLGSLVMSAADHARIPAGTALAVDRNMFAGLITERLRSHPLIEVVYEEVVAIPNHLAIVATGPLTSDAFGDALSRLIGPRNLYFYDAIAPIVTADSIDLSVAFKASRYGKGGEDYINCPLDEPQYYSLIDAIAAAEKVELHSFERPIYFEGCMPIEEMVRRGPRTLAFGPMRPVGLRDPRTGRRPFAVVQLRQDDHLGHLFNMVGFQTKMTYSAQRRVFRMIPGLERAEFVRLGSLHRNTFIDSPRLLHPTLQLKTRADLFLAGQMIGVEGYVESAATGLLAAINAARAIANRPPVVPPRETSLGALVAYVTTPSRRNFQPMNASYGLMPACDRSLPGRANKMVLAENALNSLDNWIRANGLENSYAPLPSPNSQLN
jgi:methylenetetrahydrofolate--tRNA-(uracil-5-)-methyltransferase